MAHTLQHRFQADCKDSRQIVKIPSNCQKFLTYNENGTKMAFLKLMTITVMMLNCQMTQTKNTTTSDLVEYLLKTVNNIEHVIPSKQVITLGLDILNVIDVDFHRQVVTIDGELRMEWTDSRLVFNPDDFGGIEKLVVSEDISVPYIRVLQGTEVSHGHFQTTFTVKTGSFYMIEPIRYELQCNIHQFESDNITCELELGSPANDLLSTIQLVPFPSESLTSYVTQPSLCSIINAYSEDRIIQYEHAPKMEQSAIAFIVEFNCGEYTEEPSVKELPISLAVILTPFLVLAVFILPPHAGERLIFCALIIGLCIFEIETFLLHNDQLLFVQIGMICSVAAALLSTIPVNLLSFRIDTTKGSVALNAKFYNDRKYRIARILDMSFFICFALILIVAVILTFSL